MDKDKEESKSLKLSSKERKILRSIDKSSKWEDVKAVEELNKEIIDLDIYKDFIGLGCSRYLNQSADSGKLDIDEMFRNCREAEKVRQRFKKKERREQAKEGRGGKAGLGRGNVGAITKESTIKDIDSKQGTEPTQKQSEIIKKAREVANTISSKLSKSISGKGWKETIARLGLKAGLDTLFGITIAVMEYGQDDPIGAVSISATAIGLIATIYSYVVETDTGKNIVGNVKDWFTKKWQELLSYLRGENIKVIKKKKKKKKKPFDKGGGKKDDDDDDDDDDKPDGDSLEEDLEFDFQELQSLEDGLEERDPDDVSDTGMRPRDQKSGQDLTQTTSINPPAPDALSTYLRQQSYQQQTALVNANNEKLFQKQAENPIKKTPAQAQEEVKEKAKVDPNTERQEVKAETLQPESINRGGMFSGAGFEKRRQEATGKEATGRGGVKEFVKDAFASYSMFKVGSKLMDAMGSPFTQPTPSQPVQPPNILTASQQPQPQDNSLMSRPTQTPTPSILQSASQTEISGTNLTPQQKRDNELVREEIAKQRKELEDAKQKEQEQQRKVNEAIEDMDIRSTAWGLINPASQGKMVGDSLSSLLTGIGMVDRVRTLNELQNNVMANIGIRIQEQTIEEQQGLLQDVETQNEQIRQTAEENARQNKILLEENEKLQAQMSLVRAREGLEPERKMTPEEQQVLKEQEELEEQQKEQKQKQRAIEREQELERIAREFNNIKDEEKPKRKFYKIKTKQKSIVVPEEQGQPGMLVVAGNAPDNAPPLEQDAGVDDKPFEIEEAQMEAEEVVMGRGRPKLKPGEIGKQNPDRQLVFETLQRPHIDERGRSVNLLYSFFEGDNINLFRENIRQEVREYISNAKREARSRNKNASKLLASDIKNIADIIRRGFERE